MKKPQPIVVMLVCDVCGLDWDLHPEKATVLDCVDLLKGRLANRTQWSSSQATYYTYPATLPAITYTNNI